MDRPLLALMILARAQRGGPANVFRFRDLDEPLRAALAAFGPPQEEHRAELAFWELRDDVFWVVHDEARIAQRAGDTPPSRALLVEEDAAAEVPEAAWEALRTDPGRTARLIHQVMTSTWPAERHGEILAELVFDFRIEEEALSPS
ncbi:Hypothetical protein A7982_05131 [Minicystis rosea]|nr:Hypothetical protein A7982_05131 [Minicystis rosea]